MRLMTVALATLFPPSCIGCDRVGSGLCERCAPGEPSIHEVTHGVAIAALGSYEGILRRAVLAVKDGRRDVTQSLGELLAIRLPRAQPLVPIPTTRRRRAQRGFDQATLLARAYRNVNANVILPVLCAAGDHAQHGRSRHDRLAANARFVVTDPARVYGRSVVLIDDVITTGATVAAAAATLRAAGAHVAAAIAVARTLHGR